MFFQSLKDLLVTNASINFTVVNNGSDLTITIIPKNTQSHLKQPLCITATAEELDNQLIGALTKFNQEHTALSTQLAEQKANLQEEAKAAKESAKSSVKGKTKPATTTTTSMPELGDDGEECDPFGGAQAEEFVTPKAIVQPEQEVAALNLFSMGSN